MTVQLVKIAGKTTPRREEMKEAKKGIDRRREAVERREGRGTPRCTVHHPNHRRHRGTLEPRETARKTTDEALVEQSAANRPPWKGMMTLSDSVLTRKKSRKSI